MQCKQAYSALNGPRLSKSAALQFEHMDKRAQAEILASPETPPLVKLALAAHHTKGLSKEARAKLVHHVYSKMASHEKEAIGKLLMGAGKMLGRGFKAMKPGFGNSPALQGQLRSLGGVNNVRHNLGAMGQWARQGVPMKNLTMRGGHGLGHFPTMMRPMDAVDDAAGAVSKAAPSISSLGKTTASMGQTAPAAADTAVYALGKTTAAPTQAAGAAKTLGPMDSTMDYAPSRPGVYDPHSVLSDPLNLDAADRASINLTNTL